MRVRDRRFIKNLYRAFGLPAPAAGHVELSSYGRVAGYCINVVAGRRVLASIAWAPVIEERAHVLKGLPAGRADVTVVNRLVVAFLKRHRYGLTSSDCLDITKLVIGALGEAIAHKNWSDARYFWTLMSPLHAMLIEHEPMCAHVGTALAQNEAMAG